MAYTTVPTTQSIAFPDHGLLLEILKAEGGRTREIDSGYGPALASEELVRLRDVPLVVDDWSGGGGASQAKDAVPGGYSYLEGGYAREPHLLLPPPHLTEVPVSGLALAAANCPSGVTASAEMGGDLYFACGRYVLKIAGGTDDGPLMTADLDLGTVVRADGLLAFDDALLLGTSGTGATLRRKPSGGAWSQNAVAGATVTLGGSGYTSAPTVTISGGGGSGATATATVTAGAVTAVTITNGGTGYTTRPTVAFSGGGGTGATAVAGIAPTVRKLASVFWERQGPDGQYLGSQFALGNDTDTTIAWIPIRANVLDDRNWSASLKVGGGVYPIRSLVAAPRHAYVCTSGGVHDLDELGNTANLNPDQALHRDDAINGAAGLFHGGYVYFSDLRGLGRIYVGNSQLHDESTLCGPGTGQSNETPVFGIAGRGVCPYALTAEGGRIVAAFWNGTDSYICSGIDRRAAGREGPGPMLWHTGELHLPGERVTHLRISAPPSRLPRLWVCSIDAAGAVRLRWAPLPGAGGVLQEWAAHLDADGTYTGEYRWSTGGRAYQTRLDAGDDNAVKIALRWDGRSRNLDALNTVRVFAKDESSSSYVQQGSGPDPRLQRSPRDELLPVAAGGGAITVAHAFDTRLDLASADALIGAGTGATAGATLGGGGVASVAVTAGGRNYGAAPIVRFRGTCTSPAAGVATIANGQVVGVAVTSPGAGYTVAPAVELLGQGSTRPAMLRQVQLRVNVVSELRYATTYTIRLAPNQAQNNGARAVGSIKEAWQALRRLQTDVPVRFVDEYGDEKLVKVEPGIRRKEYRWQSEGGPNNQREWVAVLTVSDIATSPADLAFGAQVAAEPVVSIPLAFKYGVGTRWGSGRRWS